MQLNSSGLYRVLYVHVLTNVIMFVWTELYNELTLVPHIDAFWRHCSRRHFENIVAKEEIAQNEQFILLPHCFQLFSIFKPSFKEIFHIFPQMVLKSSAADLFYVGKG